MFRDFSQEAKEKLISYVNDTSSDGIWQIIKNSIDYMDVKIKNWLHTLDSYAYLSQMDGYYQTVLNKHDTTIEQIEQIFTAVEHEVHVRHISHVVVGKIDFFEAGASIEHGVHVCRILCV